LRALASAFVIDIENADECFWDEVSIAPSPAGERFAARLSGLDGVVRAV
jgi:hypothetical protein